MSISLIKRGSFNLPKVQRQTQKMKSVIPRVIANMAVKHYNEGFRRGGYMTDKSATGWAKRKKTREPGRRAGGAILVKSGTLRADIRPKQVSWTKILIGTGTRTRNYAEIQNDGGTINHPGGTFYYKKDGELRFIRTTKAREIMRKRKITIPQTEPHKITIPQREYIGHSRLFDMKVNKLMKGRLDKIFRTK